MNTKLQMLTLAMLATLGLAGSAFAQTAPPPPTAGTIPDPTQATPPMPPPALPLPPTSSEGAATPPVPNAPMPPTPPAAPMPPPASDAPPPPAAPMPPMPAPMGAPTPPAAPMGGSTGTSTDTTAGASGPVSVTSHPGNSISSNYHVDFDAMDTNHDGKISRAEAKGNADLMREFRVVDRNHDGRLSKDEMKGWLK